MKDKNIGFIGLGNVGKKIANNLIKNGYNLYINDLNQKSSTKLIQNGAIWCQSIDNLINNVSVFITCLPSPKSVKKVLSDSLPLITKGHLWIEMSTTDEEDMKSLAKLIINKNAEVIEAPLSGGQHRAESGNISVLVGGNRDSFNRSFPILSCIGHNILHCGEIGKASTLKVVTNYLASINLLAIGEALMVCKKYGIDLKTAYEGIKISSGNSFVHETESQVILSGSYNVNFTMDLVCKDVGLFQNLVERLGIKTDLSLLITEIFNEGRNTFGDKSWSTKIVKRLEDACHDNLRAVGFPSELVDNEIKTTGIEL